MKRILQHTLHSEGLECPLSQTVNYYQCAAVLTQKLEEKKKTRFTTPPINKTSHEGRGLGALFKQSVNITAPYGLLETL
jgi:hypothetical protein